MALLSVFTAAPFKGLWVGLQVYCGWGSRLISKGCL